MNKSVIESNVKPYLLEERLDEKSENTIIHYEHVIRMFIDSLKNEEVTKNDLMEFKLLLMNRFKPRTVSNYITIVNKYIKYLELINKDEEFEFTKLKKHHSKQTLKNIKIQNEASLEDMLEPEELKRMLRISKKIDYEMYLIMKIFSFTGIRIEELKIFTVENIATNYIQVRNKGKIREIILRKDLRNELVAYCKNNNIESGYIFKGKYEGTMLHHTTIYRRLKKVAGMCRGIKKEKVYPHSFRHLFAVKFIEEGGDITELADILGHSSVDTTRIYTRTTSKMKRKRLEKMRY